MTETETTASARQFEEAVNVLCDQRNAAIGTMRRTVLESTPLLDVNTITREFAAAALGVVRDQVPHLRAVPAAPAGWDALVTEYERRVDAARAAGDAVAFAFSFFDPLRGLDRRAYELGATRCPIRLLDGVTRTPQDARFAVAASEVCMDLMTAYGSAVMEHGGFVLGPTRLQPFRTNDDVVDDLSVTIARAWTVAEPALRAIPAPATSESTTIAGLIDGIDAVLAELPAGELAIRRDLLKGAPFDALDTDGLERYGLLGCTLRDVL
jgi:hypothetical protein